MTSLKFVCLGITSLLTGFLGTLANVAVGEEIVARLSYHWGPAHHSAIHSQLFADRVNERGKGKIRIDTFPAGQLFGIREVMGALTAGAVEMGGVVGVVSFPPINKNYSLEALPGRFKDYNHLRGFFQNTEAGKGVMDDILTKTRTKIVAYNPTGPFMTFTAKRALTTPEAFDGLKARYLTGVERPRWAALGSDAISMATREVYTALQSGMIDTFSTVPAAIKAYSWWEYVKYGQLPYQFFADANIMMNAEWFDGLPSDVQELLMEVGQEITEESTASIMQFSADVLAEFESRGGQVDVLTSEQVAAFTAIEEEKVYPAIAAMVDPDVFEALQKYLKDTE